MMKQNGLENPNWNIVDIDDLNIKAGRSNCTLSNKKLSKHFTMPNVRSSLEHCIQQLSEKYA